jgi:hypothetical protein
MTLAGLLTFSILTGCAPKVIREMPRMGKEAVPDLQLEPRPKLSLTDEQIIALHKFSPAITGEFLKNQAAWQAYAEVAEAAVQGYRDYLKRIFQVENKEQGKQ